MSTLEIILMAAIAIVGAGGTVIAIRAKTKNSNKIQGNSNNVKQNGVSVTQGNADNILYDLIKKNTEGYEKVIESNNNLIIESKKTRKWLIKETKRIDRLEEIHKKQGNLYGE